MQRALYLLLPALCAALICAGCQRISLSKGGGGTAAESSSGGGFSLPSINLGGPAPPDMTGEWKVSFHFDDKDYASDVNFVQKGNGLFGDGQDDTGVKFLIVNGTVNGTKVHFTKKYADADPSKQAVDYTGELTYQNDAEFKGWLLGGHYKMNDDGKPVDDKWVAITAEADAESQKKQEAQQAAEQQAQQQADQPQQQQSDQQQTQNGQQGEQQQQAEQTDTANGGEVPQNVSGMYTAAYDYNFKKIDSRLWLKQQDDKVHGDGTDATTGEYFVISKGFYKSPRIMLVCHYEKGKHAKATRDLTVRAVVAPGGSMKGETHFGSPWNAKFVHRQ
jgi:hypothetical protein